MINEILFMNGYGIYVWSSFIFTLGSFLTLYLVIKSELIKEQNKFEIKFKKLEPEKVVLAKKQDTYREILSDSLISKI
tara:strand:+ start:37 stop:270 length:234 start_codon:yes stop_codon:yes gene_type:complete